MIFAVASFCIAILYLILRYSFFIPAPSGVRILMYHDLSPERRDFLTVTVDDFRAQLKWLQAEGYRSISLSDALGHFEGTLERASLPERPVLLTFDDGYRSNVQWALPILQEFDFQATIFVTSAYIQEREDQQNEKYLSVSELQAWTQAGMSLALHSHAHPNYRQLTTQQVIDDLRHEEEILLAWKLPFAKTLAYPFGARPKPAKSLQELKSALADVGVRSAFRIGNRVQPFYSRTQDRFELKRIDIRGDESFFEFRQKVRKGRTKQL